jgi:hypothetical protein
LNKCAIIGVNTFRDPHVDQAPDTLELARSTEEEKRSQLKRLADFHERNKRQAPKMMAKLERTVIDNGNVFEVLMDAVRVCSLGQIVVVRKGRQATARPEVFRFLCARRVRDFELSFVSSVLAGVAGGSAPCIFHRQVTPPAG